jgi:uncharacterized membrane protein YccC
MEMSYDRDDQLQAQLENDPCDFPVSEVWRTHYARERDHHQFELLKHDHMRVVRELSAVQAELQTLKQQMERLLQERPTPHPSLRRRPPRLSFFTDGIPHKEFNHAGAHG